MKEVKCKTFNYQRKEHICELLNISKFDDVGLLKKQKFWVHYETDDDARNVRNVYLLNMTFVTFSSKIFFLNLLLVNSDYHSKDC